MKKLALLQLLLLPIAGFADVPHSNHQTVIDGSAVVRDADHAAAVRGEHSGAPSAWEAGLKNLGKRLIGFSYAQNTRVPSGLR
jgi:hypothetical protein